MRAAGITEDGRKIVVVSIAEARELFRQRLLMGKEGFAKTRRPPANSEDADLVEGAEETYRKRKCA